MGFEEIIGKLGIGGLGSGITGFITLIIIAIFAFGFIGGIIYYFWQRKQWNLKIEFKLPRGVKLLKQDETLDINGIQGAIETEWGKGSYNLRKAVVWLKRKGKKKIKMKPFRVQKFLQGQHLTVVQVGAEEYLPVMPESYLLFEDDETGEKVTVLDVKTDSSESRAWAQSFERDAKNTYSIQNALSQLLANPIFVVGLTIFLWGIQTFILYNRMSK